MKISVFGLGYVGLISATCLAKEGHEVIGVEINPQKVRMINSGLSPVREKDIDQILREVIKKKRLRVITKAREAVMNSDLSFICVGTPSKDNGEIDLSHIKYVCRQIGEVLSQKDSFHIVAVRSTILPGTIRNVVIPLLEEVSGEKVGEDFGICHNPEFLREGTSVYDFYHPPKTVIGEWKQGMGDLVVELYKKIDVPLFRTSIEVSEMVKYTDNLFHALKICFANEIGNYCKEYGVDSHEVMEIFCQDTKLNLSPHYLKPGFAFGGSCLPKDLRAVLADARRKGLPLRVLNAILESNEFQIKRAFDLIRNNDKRKIGFLGLSFKTGTDDLRESPLLELIERLIGKGFEITIYDPNVSLARLMGSNREYLRQHLPHIEKLLKSSLEEVIEISEVLVIGNQEKEFAQLAKKPLGNRIIVDLVRVFPDKSGGNYLGICW